MELVNVTAYRQTFTGKDETPLGYPLVGQEILLLDDHGKEVPFGEIGEIAIRSRYVSPGYWRRPEL
ncbi:MAG: AMP-binding protein [Candidatus Binatia bacterium]